MDTLQLAVRVNRKPPTDIVGDTRNRRKVEVMPNDTPEIRSWRGYDGRAGRPI